MENFLIGLIRAELDRRAKEIERLRAALKEIAAMKREDLSLADGLDWDNAAAYHAACALEQNAS